MSYWSLVGHTSFSILNNVIAQYILRVKHVSGHGEESERRGGRSEDAEEVKEILKAVSEFIGSLKEPIKELLDTMMSSLDGKKLGEEVAKFYSELKESGMPEDMIEEMVRGFFRKKLEAAPNLGSLVEALKSAVSKPHKWYGGPALRVENIEEKIKLLEELKELKPEKKEDIDKVIRLLRGIAERTRKKEEESSSS